jgi:hypothetical protein
MEHPKDKKKKSTASKHASGKTALSFKKGSANYKMGKSTGDPYTIQKARNKQVKSGKYKSSQLVKTKKGAAAYNKKNM